MRNTDLGTVLMESGGSIKTGPFGTALKASEYSSEGVPVISVGEVGYGSLRIHEKTPRVDEQVTSRLPDYLLEADDIVFGRKGAVDRSALIKEREAGYFLGSDGIRVRVGEGVNSKFIAYQLRAETVRKWLIQHAAGTTMLSLNQPTLERIPLSLPSLSTQVAIADVLGALDDKIAAESRVVQLAEDLIRTSFKQASSITESAPLMTVLNLTFGDAFKGGYFSDLGVGRPLIRIRDLKNGSPQVWTTESRPKEHVVNPGDVVVGMDAEFNAVWWPGEAGVLNQRVLAATSHFGGPAFVRMLLERPLQALEREKSATTVIHLNKSDLERTNVNVPLPEALAEFEALATPLHQRITRTTETIRRLANTRDALLPLLMSGKIKVADAEKVVSDTL